MAELRLEIRVSEADFDPGAEISALYDRSDGALGAVATFIGLVRDHFEDQTVAALHLEHYPGMTENSIEKIIRDAGSRWPLQDVLVVHRVGRLAAREQIVYVQVGSGHRDTAFAGAEYIMDYLKTDAVFWKRESQQSQDRWVQATALDVQRRSTWQEDPSPETPNPAR